MDIDGAYDGNVDGVYDGLMVGETKKIQVVGEHCVRKIEMILTRTLTCRPACRVFRRARSSWAQRWVPRRRTSADIAKRNIFPIANLHQSVKNTSCQARLKGYDGAKSVIALRIGVTSWKRAFGWSFTIADVLGGDTVGSER